MDTTTAQAPVQTSAPDRVTVNSGTVTSRHNVIVIGGGTGGISVAARLYRALGNPDVAVIEPSAYHYYQPMWTLVGAGIFPKERSRRLEADVMPPRATWIKENATAIDPERQVVTLGDGQRIGYDFLVVAPGLQIDWDRIEGLRDGLRTEGVCSIYDYEEAERTWTMMRSFEGGSALFTMPGTPIKCGGAPQKIMYLADDLWHKTGVRDRSTITFASAKGGIFPVPAFRTVLEQVVLRKGIETKFEHDLIRLRPDAKEAVFRVSHRPTNGEKTSEEVVLPYDFIHVTPPMSAPDFIKESPLSHQSGTLKGWMDVDPYTLQHTAYPNVFGLGDVAGIPTSKTGAAIRKQAPVVSKNLVSMMRDGTLDPTALYDGYTSCPIVTGYGTLVMAEFNYDNEPDPSFPFDTARERRSMYLLKKYGIPFMYWNLMLKGLA